MSESKLRKVKLKENLWERTIQCQMGQEYVTIVGFKDSVTVNANPVGNCMFREWFLTVFQIPFLSIKKQIYYRGQSGRWSHSSPVFAHYMLLTQSQWGHGIPQCGKQSDFLVSLISSSLGHRGSEKLAPAYLLHRLGGWRFTSFVSEVAGGGSLAVAGRSCFGGRTESWRPNCPEWNLLLDYL